MGSWGMEFTDLLVWVSLSINKSFDLVIYKESVSAGLWDSTIFLLLGRNYPRTDSHPCIKFLMIGIPAFLYANSMHIFCLLNFEEF